MARRKKHAARRTRGILVLLLAVVAVLAAWHWRVTLRTWFDRVAGNRTGVVAADAARIDPAKEGAQIRISGALSASGAARDPQLGVAANAAVLLRQVEMYQWQEHCAAQCRYDTAWSVPVDSSTFRERHGHENPHAPFADAMFAAPNLRLGAFVVDAALAVKQLPTHGFAVGDANLAPNMVASFGASGGVLYAGGDPAQPQVGMLRVSYRVVPLGMVSLVGVQRGSRLSAP